MQWTTVMRVAVGAALALALACGVFGQDCDRDGCSEMSHRASDTGESALAGAIASESDLVANGCQECPLANARLEVWKTDALVTDEAGARGAVAGERTATVDARGTYRENVEAGFYLVCIPQTCAAVEVKQNETTTVNLQQRFGPPTFFVFTGKGGQREEAPTFDVELPAIPIPG